MQCTNLHFDNSVPFFLKVCRFTTHFLVSIEMGKTACNFTNSFFLEKKNL